MDHGTNWSCPPGQKAKNTKEKYVVKTEMSAIMRQTVPGIADFEGTSVESSK
jgi:hypothetical protein